MCQTIDGGKHFGELVFASAIIAHIEVHVGKALPMRALLTERIMLLGIGKQLMVDEIVDHVGCSAGDIPQDVDGVFFCLFRIVVGIVGILEDISIFCQEDNFMRTQ